MPDPPVPPPPAAAAANDDPNSVAARIAATNDELRAVPESKSYRGIWKQFQRFVDGTAELTNGPPYLTRENIDTFFLVDVKNRTVGCSKILPALCWYSRYREHVNVPGFTVESDTTKTALKAQKELLKRACGTGKKGQDPHYGLKDLMPDDDRLKIMDYIYRSRPEWGPESFSFTWGNNAAVRGASDRKLLLSDLRLSFGYGAEEHGGLSRSLIVVLRKGPVHKDRHDKDEQVAVWRHKHYKLCSVFSTAAHVLSMLKSAGDTINFLHDKKDERAHWWDKPILPWNHTKDASKPMSDIYEATGVVNCKVTHHRTACLQYAGFWGLGPFQVNTMTNHFIEKQHSSYGPVAEKVTLTVMAGFKKGEPYYLERGLVLLPYGIPWYEEKLFGNKLQVFREQAMSRDGDKSTCCTNFLNYIIPWFVEVLVQDGIYFIIDFPGHGISSWLRDSIPGYERWALQTRRVIKRKIAIHEDDRVKALNQASHSAMHQLIRRFEIVEAENKELRATVVRQDQNIQRMDQNIQRILELLQHNPPQPPPPPQQQQQQQQQLPPPQLPLAPVPAPAPHQPPPPPPDEQHQQQVPQGPPPQQQHLPPPPPPVPLNINDALHPTARQPVVPVRMPATLREVYAHWTAHNLDQFVPIINERKNWQNRKAFERMEYLVRCIRRRGTRNNQTDLQSVEALQATMRGRSARHIHDHFKKNDPDVVRRNYPVVRRARPSARASVARQAIRVIIPPGPNRQQRVPPGRPPAAATATNRLVNEGRGFTLHGDAAPPPWRNQQPRRGHSYWAQARAGLGYEGFGGENQWGHTSGQRMNDPDDEVV